MDDIISKIRSLNNVFKQSAASLIPLDELCEKLSNIINSNIYVFHSTGEIFSYAIHRDYYCIHNVNALKVAMLPQHYMDIFHCSDNSRFNTYEAHPVCTCPEMETCMFPHRYYSMVPVFCNFERNAGILLIRYGAPFAKDEEVLCEYAAVVVSLELNRQAHERLRRQSLENARAQMTVKSLTFSELKAVSAVLDFLTDNEGVVILSAISSEIYVPHSTVSGALKKLETAEVIHTKTMGVKGKYVQVINPYLRREVAETLARQQDQ